MGRAVVAALARGGADIALVARTEVDLRLRRLVCGAVGGCAL